MTDANRHIGASAGPVTLVELLESLGREERRGLTFITGAQQETRVSYARLLSDARRVLALLRARGLEPGHELVIQTESNRALLTTFWACVLGGLIPVPLALAKQAENRRKLWSVWERLDHPWLACDSAHLEHLALVEPERLAAARASAFAMEQLASVAETLAPGQAGPYPRPRPEDIALVQFSSGSTGQPKGVILTHANLLSNLRGMTIAAEMTDGDSFFGWMPLTHDMGLIAFHLWPAFLGVDQHILDTAVFIRRPGLWLTKASQHWASVLGSPTFGLQLLLASLRPGQTLEADLSQVRLLFNAAEPISARTCDQFLDALAGCGLARQAMYTSYGLAEGTVGAVFPPPGREFRRVVLDRTRLAVGDQVREVPPDRPHGATFVVEGHGVPGTEIGIQDDQGRTLADGRLGRIVMRGHSVTQGYYGDPEATAQAVGPGGWLDTGDLGCLLGGELVITGRAKDVIFSHGQNFFSHDLERVAEQTPGVGPGKALAVGLNNPDRDREEVIVFLRHRARDLSGFAVLSEQVAESIARNLGLAVDHVLPVDAIPKTTSGKLRRYRLRQRYLDGEFAAVARELAGLRSTVRTATTPQPPTTAVAIPPRLRALWAEVLGLADPPADASFFALGGDSLGALRLTTKVQEELGVEVSLAEILDHPSLAAFAVRLASLGGATGIRLLSPTLERDHYPATPNQGRLYALQAADPAGIAYNLPLALRLLGDLDATALQKALADLVARHEPLRTGLEVSQGRVVQRVQPAMGISLTRLGWPGTARPDDPEELGRVLRPLIRPFDLAQPPLMRAFLLRLASDDHLLLLDLHHAVVDGASLPRLLGDLGRLYAGLDPPRPGLQFKDYAAWLTGRAWDQASANAFWRAHLGPEPLVLDFPLLAPRPAWRDQGGRSLFCDLDPELSRGLKRLAGQLGGTPNLILMAGFCILLARHAGQEDLVVATVAQGRERPGCRDMVGMFVNTLPLRVRPAAELTLAEFLAGLRADLAGALRHQDQPLEELPPLLGLARQPRRNPLFEVMFAPEDLDLSGLDWPGLRLELLDFSPGTSKFDLTLFARPRRGGYRLWLEYATSLFTSQAMSNMLGRYQVLLTDMVRGGGQTLLRDLAILAPSERRRLLVDFNARGAEVPVQATIHGLIAAQAVAHPDAPAIVEADGARRSLSHAELEQAANRLAWRLREQGLAPGQVAALLAPRSLPLVVGILAVLKAGAAYLPLEPEQPAERLASLLADSGAALLLLGEGQACPPNLPAGVAALFLNDLLAAPGRGDPPPPLAGPGDLAYIIYTSGSTGQPKGVTVEHRAAINYLTWAIRTYLDGRAGDFPLFTSMAFDLTVTSLFAPLMSGGRLMIYGGADPASLVSQVAAQDQVDVIKLTPAHLAILREDFPANQRLRVLIVGGEDLKTELAHDIWARFAGRVAIYNEYGPTEATVGCMIHRYDPESDTRASVPIGVPAANTRLYVLDRHLRPVPEGSVGELFIAGSGLARGYHRRPELTAQRFPADPFHLGERMYRSGDRVRALPNGVLEYLGRVDQQIKLHGMRIEPGEIEARLKQHPGVDQAAVILRESAAGGPRLVGYYTAGQSPPDPAALRVWLAEILPRAMLPSALLALESLPLTTNGKLDRAALPAPEPPARADIQPPRDALEEALCTAWAAVLGMEAVGVADNFFDLGGDSIKAVQIAARLTARGYRTGARDILRRQTIAELAAHVAIIGPSPAAASRPLPHDNWGELPMVAWFLDQDLAEPGHYHQSLLLEARQALDPERLEAALAILVTGHPGLRLNCDLTGKRLFVNPRHQGQAFNLKCLAVPRHGDLASLLAGLKTGWQLGGDPLFRAALLETQGAPQRLLLVAHHLLVDLVAWSVLLDDLALNYTALAQGRAPAPSPPGQSPEAWCAALRRHFQSPANLADLHYWQQILDTDFHLPREGQPRLWRLADCATQVHALEPDASQDLPRAAREKYGVEPGTLVLAALAGALRQWSGQATVLIETEGHGRHLDDLGDAPDPARGLGWYTAMYPLALRLDGSDPAAWVGQVRAQAARTPNQGLGFGVLRHLLRRPELEHAPQLPPVRFNYLGEIDRMLSNDLFVYRPADSGPDIAPANRMTCELEIVAMIHEGRLRLRLTHHRQAQAADSIGRLAEATCAHLRAMLAATAQAAAAKPTPGDFDTAGLSAADLEELF